MSYYIIGLLLSLMSWACSDDVETGREEIPVETDGGYLFAHMTNANYGKLYYAASRDGVNWETLNKGRIINSAYIGHPDICQGHDGAFLYDSSQSVGFVAVGRFGDMDVCPVG